MTEPPASHRTRHRRVTASPRNDEAKATPARRRPAAQPHQRRRAAVYRRRRALVVGGGLIGLIIVAALGWPGFARPAGSTEPQPAVTAQQPAVTPTMTPLPRTGTSAFAAAFPSSVVDFVLVAEQEADPYQKAGALEAYELTYANGPGPEAAQITVLGGQWLSAEDATTAAQSLTESWGDPTHTDDVIVDGEPVGTAYTYPHKDGTSTILWTNSVAVLQVTGLSEYVQDVYAAYTL